MWCTAGGRVACSKNQWDWGEKADQILTGEIKPSKMQKLLIICFFFLNKICSFYHIGGRITVEHQQKKPGRRIKMCHMCQQCFRLERKYWPLILNLTWTLTQPNSNPKLKTQCQSTHTHTGIKTGLTASVLSALSCRQDHVCSAFFSERVHRIWHKELHLQ